MLQKLHARFDSNEQTFRYDFGDRLPHQWMRTCVCLESPDDIIIIVYLKHNILMKMPLIQATKCDF